MSTAAVTKVSKVEILRPDDAIVVRGKDKKSIRRIKTNVSLSVDEGTLVKLFGREGDNATYVITYPGFLKISQACNVAVLHPQTIIVNGREQPNPYQDPETERVHSRSVAVGFTAYGLKTWVERSVIFDPKTSNIVDLISKGHRKENARFFAIYPAERDTAGRLVRPLGLKRSLRQEVRGEKEFADATADEVQEEIDWRFSRWAGYTIDAGMAIWVDTSCPDVYSWQREMLNRSDKSLRTCQTFSDRNALSAHPAMPRTRKFNQSKVTLDCIMWYSEGGNMGYDQSLMMIDPTKLIEAEGAVVDVAVEDISHEDPKALTKTEGDASDHDDPAAHEEEDDLPYDDANPGAAGKSQAEPSKALLELRAKVEAEEKRIGAKGPIKRARVAAGIGTDDNGISLADEAQLGALLSFLKEIK